MASLVAQPAVELYSAASGGMEVKDKQLSGDDISDKAVEGMEGVTTEDKADGGDSEDGSNDDMEEEEEKGEVGGVNSGDGNIILETVNDPVGSDDPSAVGEKFDGSARSDESKENVENLEKESVKDAHQQKEEELEAYLESLNPKPKRKSIKELLMSNPIYKNLAGIKPKIGGGEGKKDSVIFLDDEPSKRRRPQDIKRQQQIEALKDRFVRHCITAPPKSGKGEHVKLKIKKKEEDSQGIEHLVENEVDYVRNPLNEEEEAVGFLTPAPQQNTSPKTASGASRRRLQQTLLEQIRARKLKEHEERVKDFNMYNDEKDEDDKEEKSDEEEIVEDEELSENESDVDDEEEEELDDLLSNMVKKRKKKKSAFIDSEAEDEDKEDDDEDDDDDDDGVESKNGDSEDSEVDEDDEMDAKVDSKEMESANSLGSGGGSEDSLPSVQDACDKPPEISTPVKNDASDEKSMDCGADFTPKVTTAVLNQDFKRTPSDFWIPAKSNRQVDDDDLSIIPRINESQNLEDKPINTDPTVPKSLAGVISEPKPRFDDLVDLCSGRFVSQANAEVADPQDEDEFDGFDFGDDAAFDEAIDKMEEDEKVKTPKADTSITAVDGITPKLYEKVPKARLLMQFNEEAEKTCEEKKNNTKEDKDNSDDEEEDIIAPRIKARKQKRLQFSDDEDDGPEEEDPSTSQLDELESEEDDEQVEEEEIVQEKPAANSLFYNKFGRMKRKFVEDEAELSGSEEGSEDEDEKGLNHYEMEEGDDEELDEDAVRNEVERVHLKQLLDDDDREIRLLQNAYLENGDLHSDKQRERKFTWKINMNDLNDDAHFGDSDQEEVEETPEDASLKQAWIEKRKWMSENSHLLEADGNESQSLLSNSAFLKIGKNTIKRLESFVDTSTSESSNVVIKETSSVQRRSIYEEIIKTKSAAKKKENTTMSCSEGISFTSDTNDGVANNSNTSVSQPLFGEASWTKLGLNNSTGSKKGSFLSRGGMMLAKFADSSKPGDAVSNIKGNSRNFVFQHITPPNPEKTDGSTSRVKRATGPVKAGNQAPGKKLKIDRSFTNLDEASKGASIFKWL